MFVLLLLFTGTFAAHLVFSAPPDCGCLGELRLFEKQKSEAYFLFGRNALLAAMLIPGLFVRK